MITRYRGDTYPMQWTLQLNGVAVNLTGYLSVTFALNMNGTVITIAGVITDAANGIVTFAPTGTEFDSVGSFICDIQAVDAGGLITTYIKDTLEIVDDVNKA